jgi:hypothetical protein
LGLGFEELPKKLTGFLELYEGSWPQLLRPEDHEHEEAEDRSACANCRLEEASEKMNAFEAACLDWFRLNVSPATIGTGLVAELFREEGLKGMAKRFFIRAFSLIYEVYERVDLEKMKATRRSGD